LGPPLGKVEIATRRFRRTSQSVNLALFAIDLGAQVGPSSTQRFDIPPDGRALAGFVIDGIVHFLNSFSAALALL